MCSIRLPAVLVVLFQCAVLSAQPYNFASYSLADGLPQSQVFALCPDSRGYLWLGTQGGGLSRFDGERFTTLTTADGLLSNYIGALAEDKQQQLWIGTNQGLCRYGHGTFKSIKFEGLARGPEVYALARIQENLFWIGTDKGLFACATDKEIAHPVPLPGLRAQPVVTAVYPTPQGIWVGTESGAWLIGSRTMRLTEREGLAGNIAYAFARDGQGGLWVASLGGLAVLDEASLRVRQVFREPELSRPMCLLGDSGGKMWVGTQNKGLLHYNPADSSWTQFLEKDGLPHQYIRCLQRDYAGRLWLGSSGGGLARLSRQPFRHFDQSRGLSGNRVYALCEDRRGRLWLGVSQNGLQVLDSTGIHTFERDSGYLRIKCKTIAEDPDGNIWVGTEGKGIAIFDSSGMQRLNRGNGLPGDLVQKIVAGRDGSMWVALLAGGIAQVWREPENRFALKTYGLREGLPDLQIQTLLADSSGAIWFATQGGQVGCIRDGAVAAVYGRQEGLPGVPVRVLALDRRGRIWAGTKGAGIFRADPQDKNPRFQPLDKTRTYSPNIYLLAFDVAGNLWSGSETGVDRFLLDPDGVSIRELRHYGRNEGFLGIETCQDAVLEDHNGRLWFGTMNGLMQYLPVELEKTVAAPLLHFETLSLFYKPLPETAYAAFAPPGGGLLEGLSLPHNQNHLSFAFRAVDLVNPEALRYRWRLDGAETEWSPLSTQTQVNYAKLAPGNYTFEVQATTDGKTFSAPVSASFVIRQPLWQLWWFQLSAGLVLLALVVFSALAWVRRIRRTEQARREKLEVENRLLQLEQKALQLQMNPHFIFNALTSIQALITEKEYPQARQEISRFAQLMRGILSNSRRQAISLQEEVQTLDQYLQMEQFCHPQKFTYDIALPENTDPAELDIPPMLLQPFVENAVVHGVSHLPYPGHIAIRFSLVDELLCCAIRDNGVGRERAARLREEKKPGHQSVALQVTQERLAALGGVLEISDISDENGAIAGTEVLVSVPVALRF